MTKQKKTETVLEVFKKWNLDHLDWRTIRVDLPTCSEEEEKINLKKIQRLLKKMKSKIWVFGHEKTTKDHYHIVFGSKIVISEYKYNNLVKDVLGVSKNEFAKSGVRTTVYRSIQYSIKDGMYWSKGLPKDFIENIYQQSTKKYNKDEFAEALINIENSFYQKEITLDEFSCLYGEIRSKFGQRPDRKTISLYLKTHYFKRFPKKRDDFYLGIASDIKNGLI